MDRDKEGNSRGFWQDPLPSTAHLPIVGRSAKNDIVTTGKFANTRFGNLIEVSHHQLAIDQVTCVAKDAVACISLVAPYHQLCCQDFATVLRNLDMDVRRWPSRIGNGLDRAKAIAAVGRRLELSVTLEILILLLFLLAAIG